MLLSGGVPAERITVVVGSDVEAEVYSTINPDVDVVVSGESGSLARQRNWIVRNQERGSWSVQVDDDLGGLDRMVDSKTLAPVEDIGELFDRGFDECLASGSTLWGVYAVRNPYFMRARVTRKLAYVCGGLFGQVVSGDDHELVTLEDKEDFERSIRHYLADGRLVRFDDVAMRTTGYSGAGGMQVDRTPGRVDWSARQLVERYPELCSLNLSKRSGWAEVRLRDRRARRDV